MKVSYINVLNHTFKMYYSNILFYKLIFVPFHLSVSEWGMLKPLCIIENLSNYPFIFTFILFQFYYVVRYKMVHNNFIFLIIIVFDMFWILSLNCVLSDMATLTFVLAFSLFISVASLFLFIMKICKKFSESNTIKKIILNNFSTYFSLATTPKRYPLSFLLTVSSGIYPQVSK